MHRVRYYNQLIEPSYFRGLRGFWIRVLNRIRMMIEFRVAKHVLKYLAKEDGHSRPRLNTLLKEFRQDVKEEKELLRQEPSATVSSFDGEQPASSAAEKIGSRRGTEAALARLMAGPRSKRYTKQRDRHTFLDLEGDFEAVDDVEVPTMEVSYARDESPRQH